MTAGMDRQTFRTWTSESYLTPALDRRLERIVVGRACSCFDVDRVVENYEKRHSSDFGWYESESKKVTLPPLNSVSKENLRFLLGGIKKHYVEQHGCNPPQVAYMLATARVEAYDYRRGVFFGPVAELISYKNAEIDYGVGPTARRAAFARKHGQQEVGDGYKYRGRGYVQITWRGNYHRFSSVAGVDLVAAPDLATQPDVALKIMIHGMVGGLFTGKKLDDYLGRSGTDYFNARRIINGVDRAKIIAEYAEKFHQVLVASGCPHD